MKRTCQERSLVEINLASSSSSYNFTVLNVNWTLCYNVTRDILYKLSHNAIHTFRYSHVYTRKKRENYECDYEELKKMMITFKMRSRTLHIILYTHKTGAKWNKVKLIQLTYTNNLLLINGFKIL